jgi:hypothetical protein
MCKKIKYFVLATLCLISVTKSEGDTVASLSSALGIGFTTGCVTGLFPPIGPMMAVPTAMYSARH